MFKKTLISLAVASSLGLTGCLSGGDEGANANPDYPISQDKFTAEFEAKFAGKVYPLFDPVPAVSQLPIPNDLIYAKASGDKGLPADGSYSVSNPDDNPVIAALNGLSGSSTVAPIDIQLSGKLEATDPAVLAGNVFLIETKYASGEPLRGLSASEPATVSRMSVPGLPGGVIGVDIEIKELKTEEGTLTDFIRISPKEPLKPNTRYIVVIKKGLNAADGNPIVSSPRYTVLKDNEFPDPNYPEINSDNTTVGPGLDPVVNLINKLWEPIAEKTVAPNRADIALAYSFTTSNDEKVLTYMANPAKWFEDQVKALITSTAAKKVRGAQLYFLNQIKAPGAPSMPGTTWDIDGNGIVNAADFAPFSDSPPSSFLLASGSVEEFGYADVDLAVQGALAQFVPSVQFPKLVPAGVGDCDAAPTADSKLACTGEVLYGTASNVYGAEFPAPSVQTVDFSISDPTSAQQVSAVLSSVIKPAPAVQVDVHQASITLPYYLGTPVGGDTAKVRGSFWTADTPLASILAKKLGLKVAQSDADASTVVNSIFPFPEKTTDQRVPMLVMTPKGVTEADLTNNANNYKVAIFQHGITTDRSAALGFGSALINNSDGNLIVVAIDQPLHGVAPFSSEEQDNLATNLLTAGQGAGLPPTLAPSSSNNAALIAGQLNIGFVITATPATTPAQAQQTIELVLGGGTTGNPGLDKGITFLAGAENAVANAGSTIPGLASIGQVSERHFNLATNATNDVVAMNFDPANAVGGSGDLFINLKGFLNSRDNLRQGAVDLMNLRRTIASWDGVDQDNVFLVGHSLGTVNGTSFVSAVTDSGVDELKIAGAHLLTPASGIVRMLENSPSFAPKILGGLSQPAPLGAGLMQGDANLETFFNVFQAALDSTDPINFADNLVASAAPVMVSQVTGDRTTVNAAYEGFGSDPWVLPAELNIPQFFPIRSSQAPLAGSLPLAKFLGIEGSPFFADYAEGVHGTPVLPTADVTKAPDYQKLSFSFLKDRTFSAGGDVVVTQQDATVTFEGMVGATLTMMGSLPTP
ncbi:hypothetical protein [Marinobacter sp. DY40_1A1]|uniref:hypothetical protein n=1 Tax=Marinobacter sp. DY40_1A1 TaxID=2583229 RepID=UPI0019088C68|nr:hypothetical protein [Marinobacter sp. DY40_1A1]MBK1886686.1 hypothetical protein [Marinobacter sp. DY40_1A1]